MHLAYVKGNWKQADQAFVAIQERGFRYGDGVFETIRAQGRVALFLEEHLARLSSGLQALRIPAPAENLHALCAELLRRNETAEGVIRISVSRGTGSRGYLPDAPQPPTVVAELLPLPAAMPEAAALWLCDIRKPGPRCLPVQHKLMQGVNSTLARLEAAEHGCDEALMLGESGLICEAGSANIFWRDREGVVHTPALECGVLAGICRETLLRDWPEEIREGAYSLNALEQAESVMLTNAVNGPMAVRALLPQEWQWLDDSLVRAAQALWQKAILRQLPQPL